jgi:hypothetical protein
MLGSDAEHNVDLRQLDWDIDVERFFLSSHMSSFREMELTNRNHLKRPGKRRR